MNEFGNRVCEVLNLPKDHVVSVQVNETVHELPTATIVMQIWPGDMAEIMGVDP